MLMVCISAGRNHLWFHPTAVLKNGVSNKYLHPNVSQTIPGLAKTLLLVLLSVATPTSTTADTDFPNWRTMKEEHHIQWCRPTNHLNAAIMTEATEGRISKRVWTRVSGEDKIRSKKSLVTWEREPKEFEEWPECKVSKGRGPSGWWRQWFEGSDDIFKCWQER